MLTILGTLLTGMLIGFAIGKVNAYLPVWDSIYTVVLGPIVVVGVAIFIWYPGAVYGWFCLRQEVRSGKTVLSP